MSTNNLSSVTVVERSLVLIACMVGLIISNNNNDNNNDDNNDNNNKVR